MRLLLIIPIQKCSCIQLLYLAVLQMIQIFKLDVLN